MDSVKMQELFDLQAIIENEIDNAIGYINTETVEERRNALMAYNREPYGNEVEGRSTIVTGEVAEAVDGALPQLLRVFTQSDDVVRFEPKAPGDEEKAKQATEYCNWVLMNDNPGFEVFQTWFKDALLQKAGVIKVWWNDETSVDKEKYENLSEEELTLLLADGQMEVVKQRQTQIGEVPVPPTPEQMMMAQQTGVQPEMTMQPVFSYNVTVKKINKKGSVKVENVPPEEFLISKKARRIADAPFVAHRRLTTRSELISMGFKASEIDELPAYDDLTFTPERVARFPNGEQPDDPSLDTSMDEIETFECYIRTDYDEDGIAELRRVFYAGQTILENEECDFIPFCSICPIPMPHKFFGHSLADRVVDIQKIKTTITRQMLDNLYLANNARMAVVDGQCNLDDLLTVTPGGIVRVKNNAAITPLAVPMVAGQAFPMLAYMDEVQQKRTGVTQASQGLDPNILQNTTATAVAMVQNAGAAKVELIARIFAETGVKDLFKSILHLVCKYQDKERIVRMRGKFVAIDPREWSNEYDLTVNVGLGTGNREQQMAMVAAILQKQEQIMSQMGIANPLVSPSQYRNTLGRFIESAGFKDTSEFFREITPEMEQQLLQPQQPQPDPATAAMMQQAQAQMQITQAKAQADIQLNQAKAQADIQLQREKAAADIQLAREKAAAQMELKSAEFQAEAQLKAFEVVQGRNQGVEIPG
jgi:hypothetical protein